MLDLIEVGQFRRNYKKLFKHEPGIVAAQAYESVDLLLFLVRTYKIRDREQLKQAIDHVNDFPGVMGLINVEPSGKWRKTVYLFSSPYRLKDQIADHDKQLAEEELLHLSQPQFQQ